MRKSLGRRLAAAGMAVLAGAVAGLPVASGAARAESALASGQEAIDIALDAYIFGYSLITTDVTRVQFTNVETLELLRGPVNQFVNVKRYPPADYRGVSAPNADTLYSIAWVDLAEPQVFSHPDMGDRYHLFELVDFWMGLLDSPSSRSGDGKAADYLFTGPGWQGEVPAGMRHIPMPTRYLVILGRTYADGTEADYEAVNRLQAEYRITPLSAWGKSFTYQAPAVDANPPYSMTDKPQEAILALSATAYFNKLAELMCHDAPPAAADAPMLARMARIGLEPCKPFDAGALDQQVQAALKDLPQTALAQIKEREKSMGEMVNGWTITKDLGRYGTDYMKRAVVAAFGWPANLQEDAVYPYTFVDSAGRTLNGAGNYTLTFAAGQEPPVKGFWSITMYQIDQGWWFVPNPLDRFTASLRSDPARNADGSLTFYVQADSPGKDKEANWLPAPRGDFLLMLRMYWPSETAPTILDGSWAPPSIQKVE